MSYPSHVRPLFLVFTLYVLTGCGSFRGVERAGVDGGVTSEMSQTDDFPVCNGYEEMLRVGEPGQEFCVDRNEVRNSDYDTFAAVAVVSTDKSSECAWKKSYIRMGGTRVPDDPVSGIDWCDARAYCGSVGKYLCGYAEGGRKVRAVTAAELTSNSNQIFAACATGQLRHTTYYEWYDAPCTAADEFSPRTDKCRLMNNNNCYDDAETPRFENSLSVSFRCCTDA